MAIQKRLGVAISTRVDGELTPVIPRALRSGAKLGWVNRLIFNNRRETDE